MDSKKMMMLKSVVDALLKNEPSDEELDYDENYIQVYVDLHNLQESLENIGY